MGYFDDSSVNLEVLHKRAFNYRWAEVDPDVIPLTAADPDFPCAPAIRQAMLDYVKDGYFSYTPKLGYLSFREAIAQALLERKGERIAPDHILPIDSAARGMFTIAKAFLEPGDEMIVFDPCDFLFRESALAAGATPVMYPARLVDGRIDLSDLEDYVTPRTKMLGLCNPHNPYGVAFSKDELGYIMDICERHDLKVMNDEIWSDIVYADATYTSIYALGNDRCKRVYSVFGFSKSFGLAGLRIGCVYTVDTDGFKKIIDASEVMSTAGGIASISQVAGEAACREGYAWVDEFLVHLKENRDLAVERINAMPGLRAYRPEATYLLYVDISAFHMTGAEFVAAIEQEERLALIPGGREFFGDLSEGHIRICIATSRKILVEALDRLERGVRKLAQAVG